VEGLVGMGIKLRVQQNAGKFLSSCTTGGFSRRTQLHEVLLVLNCEHAQQNSK
jgi:hypothetical protein